MDELLGSAYRLHRPRSLLGLDQQDRDAKASAADSTIPSAASRSATADSDIARVHSAPLPHNAQELTQQRVTQQHISQQKPAEAAAVSPVAGSSDSAAQKQQGQHGGADDANTAEQSSEQQQQAKSPFAPGLPAGMETQGSQELQVRFVECYSSETR